MKHFLIAISLLSPTLASAEGYVLGAGRWTCADIVRVSESGSSSEIGQFAGWLFGYWTAATFTRETGFTDVVENVGGQAIMNATIDECKRAPADTMVYQIANGMIDNTK